MGKKEVNPLVIVVVVLVVVVMLGYFGWKAVTPPTPAAGSYTPGVPPWMEKNGKANGTPASPVPPGAPGSPKG